MISSCTFGRTVRVAVLSIAVAGCGSAPHWWGKPGVTEADFKRDDAACIKQATLASGDVNANQHRDCLDNLGYYTVEDGKGWRDARK